MKKYSCYINIIVLLFFAQKIRAQNVDGDGMYITILSDSIVECQDVLEISVETCHISQLSIAFDSAVVTNLGPFEIEIDISYARTGNGLLCHDTTFLFPLLSSGNYKFIIKSSVEDPGGLGWFSEDDDSVFVTVNRPIIDFNPFPDQEILCKDGSLTDFLNLDAGIGFNDYTWSNGSKDRFLFVENEGWYTVTIEDNDGCIHDDSVLVINDCPTSIYVPNSFTPNEDGVNDEFRIYGEDINLVKMQIFNRWGGLIFETNELNNGWSGIDAPIGVYSYQVVYFDNDRVRKSLNGRISLIR